MLFWYGLFLTFKYLSMATITSFEQLEIWKKAQDIGKLIYFLCNDNQGIAKDFSFKDQLKRAALSVSNNIAEGFEYSNNNDFYRFLRIAKGSCGEVRNCLLFSNTIGYCDKEQIQSMVEFYEILGTQIGRLMKYLRDHKLQKGYAQVSQQARRNLQT